MAKKETSQSKAKRTVAVKKPASTVAVAVPATPKGKYIDPLTDFGFKRIFGDKVLLMDFLDGVLNIKNGIVNLTYAPTIRTGVSKDDRTAIFDLYCTTGTGDHIIVEMQVCWHTNYKQRTIHYLSRLIDGLSKKGKDYDFSLPPVYLICIVDFEIDKELKKTNFLSRIKYMYEEINKPYYDDVSIVYLELPLFTKEVTELESNIDHWMYALKYMPKINRLPKALQKGIFQKLFDLAKIAKMTRKQQDAYYKSVENMSIVRNTVNHLQSTISTQQSTISTLQKENAELRRRLGLSGASQPRSADGKFVSVNKTTRRATAFA